MSTPVQVSDAEEVRTASTSRADRTPSTAVGRPSGAAPPIVA
ncbi:hypothetical protein SAZ11_49280 [Streptomyces sp. FXJ1.4098]|nr:hypothetical protein [Streptomyces sp. FXJ1.4098]